MKIRFLQSIVGAYWDFTAGQVVDFPDEAEAKLLIAGGIAVEVPSIPPLENSSKPADSLEQAIDPSQKPADKSGA